MESVNKEGIIKRLKLLLGQYVYKQAVRGFVGGSISLYIREKGYYVSEEIVRDEIIEIRARRTLVMA